MGVFSTRRVKVSCRHQAIYAIKNMTALSLRNGYILGRAMTVACSGSSSSLKLVTCFYQLAMTGLARFGTLQLTESVFARIRATKRPCEIYATLMMGAAF